MLRMVVLLRPCRGQRNRTQGKLELIRGFILQLLLDCRDFSAERQRKGRWERASSSPVMLEMAHNRGQRGNTMMVVPVDRQYPSESSLQPVRTEVCVDDTLSSVCGTLRAKQNCANDEVNIVVEPMPDTTPDYSCKLRISIASYSFITE